MYGIVPVMTQGSIATYYGGDQVIQQIERTEKGNSHPSLILPLFFILSLLFQMSLYLYKLLRSRKHGNNMNNNYMYSLKTSLGNIIHVKAGFSIFSSEKVGTSPEISGPEKG